MVIKGSVENIIFRNEENGYSVAELDVDGQPVTCVGNFPVLLEGQSLEVEGEYKEGKYGVQFNCVKVKYHQPGSPESIARYLASGLIRGVGPVTASAIVDKFGAETLNIIETQPSRLTQVKGISLKKAGEISSAVTKLKEIAAAVMFLQSYDVTINMALKIYRQYGESTESVLQKNPYKLIEDVEGIGFATADRIALNMGIERNSEFRVRAGLLHALQESAENVGSTFILKEELLSETSRLLGGQMPENAHFVDDIIMSLMVEDVIKCFEVDGRQCVMLSRYHNMEKFIAAKLVRIKNFCLPYSHDLGTFLQEYQRVNSITLHSAQIEAVERAVESGVSVITGGPGTGKTTIIRCVLSVLKQHGLSVLLAAPTGRAAKRLSESTGEDAKTIHRMLELDFNAGKGNFTYGDNKKLEADVVIIDEVSMVDSYLFYSLMRALQDGTKLILVGDKDQLPSVGAGNVLAEVISSGCVDIMYLTEIYRQGSDSLIVTNAHAINNGDMPDLSTKDSNFFYMEKNNPDDILQTVKSLCVERLPGYANVSSQEIQVLAPMKKGVSGVNNINAQLQMIINPPSKDKAEYRAGGMLLRCGDKVMQMSNNYRLQWQKNTMPFEKGEGVYNGDIGYIIDINRQIELTVEFEDGRVASYSASDIDDLSLAYAISVHKSQGCEFDVVVIPLTGGPPTLLTRNLLYTALTRAKKLAVLVGARYNVERMINNNYTQRRNSMLALYINEQQQKFTGLV